MSTDLERELQAALGPDVRIQHELGGGGMSRVFVAEDTRLGRQVVVKVLETEIRAELSADRFEREIRLAAGLQNPRIVPVLQAGHSAELQYYIMPLVEGQTLRERMQSPVPVEEAIGILLDVALALEYAHTRNIVHRDIKPENILLSGRTAVVTDFGIARAIDEALPGDRPPTLTRAGSVIGTPAYMAPEQAAGGAADIRADIYAWGLIAYELLSGEHPFASCTTTQAMLVAQMAQVPESLAGHVPDVPHGIADLVDRCLAKEVTARPDSAALVSALTAIMQRAGKGRPRITAGLLSLVVIAPLILAGTGFWVVRRASARRWAGSEAVTEASSLRSAGRALAALQLLQKAGRILPADTSIANALAAVSVHASVTSSPAGADVAIRVYLAPDTAWLELGTTPLANVTVPSGYLRWRISKPGVGEDVRALMPDTAMKFDLAASVAAPRGMAPVGQARWGTLIAFVGWVGPYELPAFYIDRTEVTNRDFQVFVDSGGYRRPEYWKEPFVDNGRTLSWDEAMERFRDRSGRPGPAGWVAGHYPEGEADYPVSGVSWFEASAWAAFAGKSLPTFAQWYETASPGLGRWVVPASNIGRDSISPVGQWGGLGEFGTLDMAGNVREWAVNALGSDRRFILGGAWDSQAYLYADPEALSPWDRSPENGFRCVINRGPVPVEATRPVQPFERDFDSYKPATDDVFKAYRAMYAYGHIPLNARDEGVIEESPDWRREKVTVDAAYGNDRFAVYLFLPKRVQPPYQAVVFFPSARVSFLRDSRNLGDTSFFDYVIQSGRAVIYPVYQNTYERRTRAGMPGGSQAIDITIQRAKDLGRTIDYLQTRSDIASDKLSYMGVSMGSAEGVIYATLAQDRLKTVIFLDGGFFLDPAPIGGDQADFAPRLTKPVLMVNGRYDFTFSYERAQVPLFRMLGTPAADKKHVVLETPHDVRADRPALVREVLAWLDRYLGRVQ